MAFEPVVGDRYYLTWEELGKPTVPTDVEVPGLGIVYLDDADVFYAVNTPGAAFYLRKSKSLGENGLVVVSRVRPA
ncbi:MAG: hypothetical protein KF812_03500 [Fimbriimonadaceae bacterium]|nr:hypothetical protein [Fimbriimonadaceae bacterium]MBX3334583.1 hypothetical protein [Nitrospira sp.]